jgi:L-alanine-DL-glutamate epimerase-like enolase superfamily enzyme
VDIAQPDVTRLGGLPAWLKVATLAEQYQRPVAPHVLPEIGVHLACGLPQVRMVEYMPWLYPAFVDVPAIVEGQMVPPDRPGLGLELRHDAVEKYRMEV